MAIHKVPLTVGYRHNKIVGHITIDPEVEKILLKGGLFVLMPSIINSNTMCDEIIELTLLPLPATAKGG